MRRSARSWTQPRAAAASPSSLRTIRIDLESGPWCAGAMAVEPLAQVNVATLRAPLDGPELAGFVAELEPINALADASPGFVWRPQTEGGDPPPIRPSHHDRLMVNLSVWASLE